MNDPELDALWREGLELFARANKLKGHTMFSKKAEPPFPRHEFVDRLNALIAAAQRAGVTDNVLETEFKKHLANLTHRRAANLSLSTTPLTCDGYGKPRS
jgi:hypothetical protein